MSNKLTNEAAWITAVNILKRLGHRIGAEEGPEVLAMIFEQARAGIVVHHFLAQEPKSAPAPSRN